MNKFKSKLKNILLLALTLSFVWSLQVGDLNAQYNNEPYGQCAYGQACPVTPPPPPPPPDPTPEPTPDPEPTPEPEDDETEEETPNQPAPSQNNGSGGGTSRPSSGPKASDRVETKGLQGIILRQTVDLVDRIPPAQRAAAPYYSWLFLLILSFVMIVIAAIDRYKSVKLSKSVKQLKKVLEEQSNFLRVALHNLNTPLAITKNSVELLQSLGSQETQALEKLRPATLKLSSAIESATSEITNTSISPDILNKSGRTSFIRTLSQWYFFVPVIISVLFAILLNSAVTYTDTERQSANLVIQLATGVMICLIFANAIRLMIISKNQQKVYVQVISLINQLRNQRRQIVSALNESLSSATDQIKTAIKYVSDEKISTILTNSNRNLESLTSKIGMATTNSISVPYNLNVVEFVRSVILSFAKDIKSKSLIIKEDYGGVENITVNADELKFIIHSLIENSVEYSKPNGNISINIVPSAGRLTLSVEDNGEGIDKEGLEMLFKPFSKTDDVLTYEHQGMGLSLFASKSICDRLGGNINVQSTKDVGTRVDVVFPIS